MTLTAVRIANFKAFAASQRVPLRPITLVFGANSAGKSSVLHALALAHHAIETGQLDTQRTNIGGESIDLGGFGQYVHRRERNRQVELVFEVDPGRLSGRAAELLRSARDVVVELSVGSGVTSDQLTLFGDRARELEPQSGARVERFSVVVNGAPLFAMSARAGGLLRLDRLDHGHPVFREVFRALLLMATTAQDIREDDFVALGQVLDALVPGISARPRGLFPRIEEEGSGESESIDREELVPISRGRRSEDLARAARLFLPRTLRDLVAGLGGALEEEIRRLQYLGPLRSYPPRHLAFSQYHDPNWFAGGGYAWDVVRARADVRGRVNAWLGDAKRLRTPYELEVRDLLPAPTIAAELPARLGKALHDVVASLLRRLSGEDQTNLIVLADELSERIARLDPNGLQDTIPEIEELLAQEVDTETLSERWATELVAARSEMLQDLVLIDKRNGTPVSHRDVGIGVSQVLPVLVSAYASKEKLLAIEQPEIHLHPFLQAELGDVFIESALGECRNSFLIETHSEHLILRLLRRIRETSEGTSNGGYGITPADIGVLFVQPGVGGSEIVPIGVTSDGDFDRPWPEGFFPERARELM